MPYHRDEPGPADKRALSLPYDDLHRAIDGVDFPADKRALLDQARRNGAEAAIVRALEALPAERFADRADVNRAYRRAGGSPEGPDL